MHDILAGTSSDYRSLRDLVIRHPFFRGYREKQKEVNDWRAPCLLIDHPKKFRELCAREDWYPRKNMPDDYLDGDIARAIDETSSEWQSALATQTKMPRSVQAATGEEAK